MTKSRWWIPLLVLVTVLLVAAGPSPSGRPAAMASPSDGGTADGGVVLCEGIYALCTTAMCAPVAGKEGLLSCKCSVQNGYSAGTACNEMRDTPQGKTIFSRYHPIQSYVACNNARPWAWCLDVPCVIDADNPLQSTATCSCTVTSTPSQTYVAVTSLYSAAACTTGIISSAT